ncbi:MAG: hypothetical protein ACI4OX_03215 [Akkermansia sp.]|nr:hypothetical protein [Akkermansia sp.]
MDREEDQELVIVRCPSYMLFEVRAASYLTGLDTTEFFNVAIIQLLRGAVELGLLPSCSLPIEKEWIYV